MSAAAIAERRFLQQQRCRILYRKALKSVLDWAVHRDIFYIEQNLETIDRLLFEGEARLAKFQHPDPYIVPWFPGGSKYARNPPVPPVIEVVNDFGREGSH